MVVTNPQMKAKAGSGGKIPENGRKVEAVIQ
jgi:hypothetical protein